MGNKLSINNLHNINYLFNSNIKLKSVSYINGDLIFNLNNDMYKYTHKDVIHDKSKTLMYIVFTLKSFVYAKLKYIYGSDFPIHRIYYNNIIISRHSLKFPSHSFSFFFNSSIYHFLLLCDSYFFHRLKLPTRSEMERAQFHD